MTRKKDRMEDLLTAAAATVVVTPWLWPRGPAAGWLPGCVAWPAVFALILPLLARRRAPIPVAYTVAAAAFAVAAAGVPAGRTAPALILAAYATTAYTDLTSRSMAAAAITATAAPTALLISANPPVVVISATAMALAVTVAAVSGYAIRTRRAYITELEERAGRLEREEGQRIRQAVADERLRIAHELHDVVGHGISVIAIQSEAATRSLATNPTAVSGFLTAITQTSRQSLAEMRYLLAVLRPDHDQSDQLAPLPGLTALEQLIAQVEAAGVPVTLEQFGDLGDLPPGVDLSAYRIVQEALTNVLKHAAPATAHVCVTRDPTALRIQVRDNGRRPHGASAKGHGLIGMRERVNVYGGSLKHGPHPDGGYTVTALIPTHDTRYQ